MSRGRGIRLVNSNGILDIEISIVKDSNGLIEQGALFGDTVEQNKALILSCHPGEIKEYPDFGCGIENILNDNDFLLWERNITEMLERDGLKQVVVKVKPNNIKLKANY